MGNLLFGVDIARIIRQETRGQLLNGVLHVKTPGTRTAGQLSGGTNPTPINHAFEGFIDNRTERRISDTLVRTGGQIVSIIGDSLPAGVVPKSTDQITIEGTLFTIEEIVSRDPAAALYEARVTSP